VCWNQTEGVLEMREGRGGDGVGAALESSWEICARLLDHRLPVGDAGLHPRRPQNPRLSATGCHSDHHRDPHPRTQLWYELDSDYGIFEKDWAKFDTKYLVWRHPQCPPGSLESLLKEGFQLCYGPGWLQRTTRKFLASRLRRRDLSNLLWSPRYARWAEPRRLPFLADSRYLSVASAA